MQKPPAQPSPESRAARSGQFDAAIFGLIVADLIASPFNLRNPPAPGGLSLIDSITLTTGGNVCNVGVAMAKLGMRVAAAGLIGREARVVATLSTPIATPRWRAGCRIARAF